MRSRPVYRDKEGMTSQRQVSRTILAISGSLRRSSINSAVLRAAAAAAQDGALVVIDDSVRKLPHFDPDLEMEPPEAVLRFRAACQDATGVLLAVPEYTFGIPGSFKNALDWTVRSGSLYRKPITLLNVAPPGRGAHSREALDLVLRAHGADVARCSIPVARSDRNAAGEVDDPRITGELRAVVAELARRSSAEHESNAAHESDAAPSTAPAHRNGRSLGIAFVKSPTPAVHAPTGIRDLDPRS